MRMRTTADVRLSQYGKSGENSIFPNQGKTEIVIFANYVRDRNCGDFIYPT
jgi:hypothetical protein